MAYHPQHGDDTTPHPYPTDVPDDEWSFLAPSLSADAPLRNLFLRELFDGLNFITRTGLPWRSMPP